MENTNNHSLTPPPSAQALHTLPDMHTATTTTLPPNQLSSPPPSVARQQYRRMTEDDSYSKMSQAEIEMMPVGELRRTVAKFAAIAQEAKTTAAHYKLQHQMSQMESGEAVERMAVEMEMARREIEVLQQADAQRQINEQKQEALMSPTELDPDFRRVHKDTYAAMLDEVMMLKNENARLECEVGDTKRVLAQQESEIASLNDKILLMRERMHESRDQVQRFRRAGLTESPRTVRATPFQTPSRRKDRPEQNSKQPGFDALLHATDLLSQRAEQDSRQRQRSVPTTPHRIKPARLADQFPLYTPQPARRTQLEVPNTAPIQRKRSADVLRESLDAENGYESDATVSALPDSEAETEIVDDDDDDDQRDPFVFSHRDSPSTRKTQSASNFGAMKQSRLFGNIQKPFMSRIQESERETKRTKLDAKASHPSDGKSIVN